MNSERTQIARVKVSAPTRWILGHVDLSYKSVLHHGEGKAILDTVAMNDAGAYAVGFDPNTINDDYGVFDRQWDIAISNYVFNTLTCHERVAVWWQLLQSSTRVLVTVRTDTSAWMNGDWMPQGDGWITGRGTFQCIQDADWWVRFFKRHSPDGTNVRVLHNGGHFVTLEVWR